MANPALRLRDATGKRTPSRFRFTKAKLADVPAPSSGRLSVSDTAQPGLTMRVTASNARAFYLYRKVQGRPVRLKLGDFPTMTIEQARKLCAKHLADVAEGINPADQRREQRAALTLAEVRKSYLENADLSPRTEVSEESLWKTTCTGLRSRRLADITPESIVRLGAKVKRERGARTADRAVGYVKRMYRHAERVLRYDGPNPCKAYTPSGGQSRERFLSADELPRFLDACDAEGQPWADLFRVMILTGARSGNVRAMRWADIDIKAATWTIPASEAKAGKVMKVAMVDEVVDILKRRKRHAEGEYVWPAERDKKRPFISQPHRPFKRICEAAGIDDLTIHDLRRTAGAWMASAGVSLPAIGKALGHSDFRATQIYARMTDDTARAGVEKAAQAMRDTLKGKGTTKPSDAAAAILADLTPEQRQALKAALNAG